MDLDAKQLQKNTFLSHFSEKEIKKILQHGNINRYTQNSTVFLQGDAGEAMYIIMTGEVEILLSQKNVEEVLATLKPGEVNPRRCRWAGLRP